MTLIHTQPGGKKQLRTEEYREALREDGVEVLTIAPGKARLPGRGPHDFSAREPGLPEPSADVLATS